MSNQGWHAIRPRLGALAASAFDPPASGGGGGGTVTPPAATSEDLPDTDTPTAKTFSAFTDTEGLIDNYASSILNIVGTTTASGSGLGPYTYSGAGPGTAFVHLLTARDASNNPLATAAHGVDIMPSPPSAVTPPAATSESVASGGTPANKTFSAFTDPDGLIDNYVSAVTNVSGTTTATGTGLGAYSYSGTADGTAFVHTLTARDASNNPLATAVHGVQVEEVPGGGYDWALKDSQSFAGLDTAGPWSTGANNITDDGGATTIGTLTVTRSGSTNGTFEVDADGVLATITSGTGNTNGALDLDSMLGGTDQAWWEEGEVIIQAAYDLTLVGSSSYFIIGLTPLTVQGTGFRGIYVPTATTLVVYGYYDATIGAIIHTGNFTSFRVTLRIWKGRYVTVGFTAGTKTLLAPESADAGSFIGQPAAASGSAPVFTTVANWLTSVKTAIVGLRLCDIRVDRMEAV